MLKMFKRRKHPAAAAEGWIKLGNQINRWQHQIAKYLQPKMQSYSPRTQTTIIMGICFIITCCSLFVLYQGINGHDSIKIEYPALQQLKIDTLK